jgi:hypothetical protein
MNILYNEDKGQDICLRRKDPGYPVILPKSTPAFWELANKNPFKPLF